MALLYKVISTHLYSKDIQINISLAVPDIMYPFLDQLSDYLLDN